MTEQQRDTLIESYVTRIRELEAQKEELVKQFEPYLKAEFARTLCELRDGEMEEEIAADFRKVVKAVMATGRKGKVTAVFTIAWKKEKELRIDLDSKPTIPKYGVDTATVWADDEGGLHRSNPDQMELFERKERTKNA